MYSLHLTEEEFQALKDVLECSIAEIHSEIVHTDRRELRECLKDRKKVMMQVLDSLSQLTSEAVE